MLLRLLTKSDVRHVLQVSDDVIERLVRQGKLVVVWIMGRHPRFRQEDVEQLINDSRK